MKKLAILTAAIALAGCKTEIASDLFTSDLIAAANGTALTAPIVLGVETSSEAKCEAEAQAVLAAVSTAFNDVALIGCEESGFDTMARFRVQAPIIITVSDNVQIDGPFAVGVAADGATIHVTYLTNTDAVRAVWDALPEDMTQFQTFAFNPTLSAVLNNDLASPVSITTDDVFSDGTPVQGTATRELPRRDQVEVRMSDVTNAAFGTTANASHVISFTPLE